MSAEGTSGAASLGREPGGDALEAKLMTARETNGVLGGISLVTDGTTITVRQISFRDNGELGHDVLCHCSDFSCGFLVAGRGTRETSWSQSTYVASRDSLRFRSSSLSGGLWEDFGGENMMIMSAQAFVGV